MGKSTYENDIKKLKSEGKSTKDITKILGCSDSIVHFHLNPQTKRKIKIKQAAIRGFNVDEIKTMRGGKCENCGYDKCFGALEFHHLDSTQKDFGISKNRNATIPILIKETNKCAMLCVNCHREVHSNLLSLNSFINNIHIIDSAQEKIIIKNFEEYRAKHITKRVDNRVKSKHFCPNCGTPRQFRSNSPTCWNCPKNESKIPVTKEELVKLLNSMSLKDVAKHLNVSTFFIKEWRNYYNIPAPGSGRWKHLPN